jgi:hypothetical protein
MGFSTHNLDPVSRTLAQVADLVEIRDFDGPGCFPEHLTFT